MALAARIHRVGRGHERQAVDLAGTLRDGAWTAIDVAIEDLSRTGFRIQQGPMLGLGDTISLGLPGMGVRAASVVRLSSGGYGCEFDDPLTAGELDLVLTATSSIPIPFPSKYAGHPVEAFPPERPLYPLKVRLLGLLGLAALSWSVVLVIAAMV